MCQRKNVGWAYPFVSGSDGGRTFSVCHINWAYFPPPLLRVRADATLVNRKFMPFVSFPYFG